MVILFDCTKANTASISIHNERALLHDGIEDKLGQGLEQASLRMLKALSQGCVHMNGFPFCVNSWSGTAMSANPTIYLVFGTPHVDVPYVPLP